MKCALIEFNDYHDELFPSWVYYLNQLGYAVDIFAPPSVVAKNVFPLMQGLRYQYQPIQALRHADAYRFLIFNSLEPQRHLAAVQEISRLFHPLPALYVLHNADLLRHHEAYQRLNETSGAKKHWIVLGAHMSAYLQDIVPSSWIFPGYFGPRSLQEKPVSLPLPHEGQPVRFCIQGNVHGFRKNFTLLLNTVQAFHEAGDTPFRMVMVGESDSEFGMEFKQMLQAMNLEGLFEFTAGKIPYEAYYQAIENTDFLLPLVDQTHACSYLSHKMTSSVPILLGLQRVGIVHERLDQTYGLAGSAFMYSDNQLLAGIHSALESSPELRQQKRRQAAQRNQSLLIQSLLNLKQAMQELNLPTYPSLLEEHSKLRASG